MRLKIAVATVMLLVSACSSNLGDQIAEAPNCVQLADLFIELDSAEWESVGEYLDILALFQDRAHDLTGIALANGAETEADFCAELVRQFRQ